MRRFCVASAFWSNTKPLAYAGTVPRKGLTSGALPPSTASNAASGAFFRTSRFNTVSEIRMLMSAGVTAVSQTAGPETVLAGEAKLPYALLGYATDYANGVKPEAPTPVEELIRLVTASTETFARTLAAAVPRVTAAPEPVGTHFSWD